MNKILIYLLVILTTTSNAWGQTKLTQTIRGQVIDKETEIPLPGVNILLLDSDPLIGVITDNQGYFRMQNIPVGRQSIKVSFIGYHDRTLSNMEVSSAKELILKIELEEKVTELDAVVIKANARKDKPINKMATISARSFTVEETSRYPGSYGDPARMAANYAGVMSVRDNRNDIVIRGNSSTGLLWRLDGIEIPNPNHFAASGTTGGPITILNNNFLSNSDFFTGAFPAEYSNAIAGVFDLKMRTGNNEKREYWTQIGYNGLEFGAEGPFSKNSNASYMLAYRYSFVDLLNLLGAETETTKYQDLNFKFNIPLKSGRISMFGIGGTSYIEMFDSNNDRDKWTYDDWGEDLSNGSKLGVMGLSYLHFINNSTRINFTYSVHGSEVTTKIDTFYLDPAYLGIWAGERTAEVKQNAAIHLIKKVKTKNNLSAGIIFDRYNMDFADSSMVKGSFAVDTDTENELMYFLRSYVQFKHKFTDRIYTYAGLNGQYLFLNNSYSIEPRFGLNYTTSGGHTFNMGYGLHSQMQPKMVYYVQSTLSDGSTIYTNKDLDFTKSHQFVLGYDYSFNDFLRIKIEGYYQHLYDIPVDINQPAYSVSNYGAEYFVERIDSLVNEGKGRNYGLELTLERYLYKNFYFLLTASIYDSKYTGYDGIERNTAFNGNFAINLLGGYEILLPRNNMIGIGFRTTWAGGRPYVPFDVNESVAQGTEIYDWSRAYEERQKDYFRINLRLVVKRNRPKFNMEYGMDLQYRTNYTGVYERRIDPQTGKIYENYEMDLYPMGLLRIQF